MQAKNWTPFPVLALVCGLVGTAAAQEDPTTTEQQATARSDSGDSSVRLSLKLKDRLLRDVVQSIRRKAGVNIIMDAAIEDTVTIDLDNVEWRRALDLVAEAAGCVVVEVAGNVLRVEKPPRVYFAFENADIQKVVDTIAKISGANIVMSPEVQGPITLRLKNIPWRDALDAAVKTLGYVVVEEDRGILRVVPPSNMKADLISREFQLRFVRPRSAYVPFINTPYVKYNQPTVPTASADGSMPFTLLTALQRVLTPEIGQIQYFDGNNVIIVKDTKPVVEEIERIINRIDVEPGQIYVDVKFVTTGNQDLLNYGVDIGGEGWAPSISLGQIPTRLPFDLGAGGWDDDLIANDTGTGPFADSNLNPTGATTMPNVIFGALNFTQVQAALKLLRKDVNSEIVQAPQLIVLDHQEATIFVGETIRYAQARAEQGQAGGLQLVVEEAPNSPVQTGFQLMVVPHIIPGSDKVLMDIIPQSTSLTGTGSSNLAPAGFDVFTVGSGAGQGTIALPRVASSTIGTKVMLRSQQTAVLGGLTTESNSETETALPLLGDIPVLGWLFKNRATNKQRNSLIVFVTPTIVRSPEDTEARVRAVLEEKRNRLQAVQDAIFGRGEGR
jgi:type IV pilus assembly protein PilQ